MKKFLRAIVLSILSLGSTSKAHASQEQNQIVFDRLKAFINTQAADSIYEMLTADFQKKFPAEVFKGFLKVNIFPLGTINASSLLKYKEGVSVYRVDFEVTQQELVLAGTDEGKIAGLSFRPYKAQASVPQKDYKVASTNALATALDKSVDSVASQYINMKHTVGLAIGLWKDGKTWTYGYGETAKGNGKIPGDNTLFEIGSISKTFTGTLLAYYVNEGKIKLDDPITRYLPDSVAANGYLKDITVQMLANHTSGLPRLPVNMSLATEAEQLNPYKNYSRDMMFSLLKNYVGVGTPGQQQEYSNLGTALLGVILERVSGKTFEQMVEKVISDPLDMKRTVQRPLEHLRVRSDMTTVYNEEGTEVLMWDFDAMAAAGALKSTVSDMLRFTKANAEAGNTTLGKAMRLAQKPTYEKEQKIGLSWHYMTLGTNNVVWHNGGTGGSSSFLAFDPIRKVGVVVLSNSAESVDEVGVQLMGRLLR